MSTYRSVRLGAYLKIEVQRVPNEVLVRQCAGNALHATSKGGAFCPQCGSRVEGVVVQQDRYPTLFDLQDDCHLDETLYEMNQIEEATDTIVAMSNVTTSNATEYDLNEGSNYVVDIDSYDEPQKMREAFAEQFQREISALEAHSDVISVEVRFGFVESWS